MDANEGASSSFVETPLDIGHDEVGLLSGVQTPHVKVTSAIEQQSSVRGRRHSKDLTHMTSEPFSNNSAPGESPDSSAKTRRSSPGPSSASALLRRLTTLRKPIQRALTTKRAQGGEYDTLEDGDFDDVPVDLSSLTGMGYELTDMRRSERQDLQYQDTAYASPHGTSEKPSFQNFVQRGPRIGDGLVIGAQIRRDPSKAAAHEASSSGRVLEATAVKRANTRAIGHNLAQERNMIVAVNEGIDLSSLEGRDLQLGQRSSSLSLDQIVHRSGTLENGPQSYFFPEDTNIPNWRPFSMRSYYILGLAAVSLGLAIFQEWLYQHSKSRQKGRNGVGGLLAFNQVSTISVWDFFAWKYLPTIITIAYAVLFSIMDFDIRRLEPYYQLSQPLGGRASASLNLDHLTTFQYFVPFKAFRLRQWPVFFSTIGNILASLAAPSIQNPSLNFVTNPKCENGPPCPKDEMQYYVQVSSPWSRALSAVLVIVAIIAVVIFFLLRRPSGLLSDPKGIAGIASMATKSHILHDFQDLDLATRGEIHKRLQHRRYVLYKSSVWQGEYSAASEPMQDSEQRMESPHPPMLRLAYGIPFLSSMVFGLLFVPLISLTPARVIPNDVPWLPILLATLLKLFFTTFESDVRLMEPFYQLSRGKSEPHNSLTLDYQGTVYGWVVIKALFNRHYLVSLVGLASMSLDVLAVTISSFSVNSKVFLMNDNKDSSNQDETFISFWTSVILSIAILTFVIIVTGVVYLRRRHPFLPREPSTIAAILAFIYASNMLDDFINTETFTHKQMEARLKGTGKTYALGWFRGRDGKIHCAIDQEPLRSKYVHGKPYTKALAPWEQNAGQEEYYV